MKRPLAVFTLIYFSVLALSVCLIPKVNLTFSVMVTILGIVTILIKRKFHKQAFIILVPISLAFMVMFFQQLNIQAVSSQLGTHTCTISGEITDIPRRQYGRWYYVVKTNYVGISGAEQSIKLRLTCRNSLEAKEGDLVTGTVTFIRGDNEAGYNSETSLLADGIIARAWCTSPDEVTVSEGSPRIKYLPLTLRRSIISLIQKALPEKSAGMLCAMLLGDTDYLDSDIVDNFRTAGIAHLLAVSGLHMSLLSFALSNLLKRLKFSPKLNSSVTIAFVVMFMAVTGFSPSVTRAGFMHLMSLISGLILRDADSLTSMSLGILAMLLLNPMSAADVGLQMSVCSTFALITLSERVNSVLSNLSEKIKLKIKRRFAVRLKKYIIASLSTSLTAALFTLPLSAVHFGKISLISPITNLLCIYAATLFIIIGITASIVCIIPILGILISFPLRFAAALICQYLDMTTELLANMPLASTNANYTYIPYFLIFAAAVSLSAFIMAKQSGTPESNRYAVCCAFFNISFLLLTAMLSHMLTASGAEIMVFGMQDGGVCVCAKNGSRAVIAEAGGDSYDLNTINDIISARGIYNVDALTVSKKSDLRSSIADELIDRYSPGYFFCGGDISQHPFAKKAAEANGTKIMEFGGAIKIAPSCISLEMFTDSSRNNWQRLKCGEVTVLICPDGGNCADLPREYLNCDALVIGTMPKNVTYISTGAVIITSEFSEASQTAYRLQVKGFKHIYMTSRDNTLVCAVSDGNLHIEKIS